MFAIRQGPWKLILETSRLETETSGGWVEPRGAGPKPGAAGQLYNLSRDPREENNLYGEHPEIVARLSELLEKIKREGRIARRP